MSHAVELFFDRAADARVRGVWTALGDAGFERRKGTWRPHVSLSVFDSADLGHLLPSLEERVRPARGLRLRMAHLGIFVDAEQPLAFLGVTPSEELLGLQRRLATALDLLADSTRDYYVPTAWTPHCTLPVKVDRTDSLLEVVRKSNLPIDAEVEHVKMIDTDSGEAVAVLV